MSVASQKGQEKALDPLELEGGLGCLLWVLEVNLAPLQEWYMPVTAELPLQSQEEFF